MAGEVRITSDVHAIVERLNGEVEAIIREEIDAHVRDTFANAVVNWPRDTNHSVSRFKLERFGEGWRLTNDADYANMIGKGEIANRLIWKPMRAGLVDVALRVVARLSGGGA